MKELIDRKALLSEYDRVHIGEPGKARKLIEDAPEAVVRCQDCKHYPEGMAIGMCKRDPERPLIPIPYNHYCGFAERKEDGKE